MLKAHQAQTNLPSVAVTGPYDPNSTALYLDELLNKWAFNILESGVSPFLKDPKEGASATDARSEFHKGMVQGKKLYLSESVDVWNYLYFFECADLVLDSLLVRYSSAGMCIISLTILYRRTS